MKQAKVLTLSFKPVKDGFAIWGLGDGRVLVDPEFLKEILTMNKNDSFWPYTLELLRNTGGKPTTDEKGNVWCLMQLRSDLRWKA